MCISTVYIYYMPFSLSIYISICMSVCLSIHLSIYPSIYLSIHLSIYLSTHLSNYLPFSLSSPTPLYNVVCGGGIYISAQCAISMGTEQVFFPPGMCLSVIPAEILALRPGEKKFHKRFCNAYAKFTFSPRYIFFGWQAPKTMQI